MMARAALLGSSFAPTAGAIPHSLLDVMSATAGVGLAPDHIALAFSLGLEFPLVPCWTARRARD